MPAYLKIENVGVCPSEGFTVLGVSLADTTDQQGVIGQFNVRQLLRLMFGYDDNEKRPQRKRRQRN